MLLVIVVGAATIFMAIIVYGERLSRSAVGHKTNRELKLRSTQPNYLTCLRPYFASACVARDAGGNVPEVTMSGLTQQWYRCGSQILLLFYKAISATRGKEALFGWDATLHVHVPARNDIGKHGQPVHYLTSTPIPHQLANPDIANR
jgi:hypothetical protein